MAEISEAALVERIDLARYARVLAGPERSYWLGMLAARVGLDKPLPPGQPASPKVQFRRAPAGKIGIGLVQPGIWSGGAERYHLDLFRSLDPERYHVVGTATTGPCLDSPLRAEYLATGPVGEDGEAAKRLAQASDIVLMWGMGPRLVERLPVGTHRARIVSISHGQCEYTRNAVAGAIEAGATTCVIVSEDCRKTVPTDFGGPVHVAVPMVEPGKFVQALPKHEQRRKWGIPDGYRVALHVARPSPEKRCHLGYRALPDGWAYVLIGTGPDLERTIEDAKRTANGPAFFPGHTSDVGSALNAADVCLLPSDREGCSIAGLEAHATTVPLIATPVGLYAEHPEFARLLPRDCTPADVGRAILATVEDVDGTATRVNLAWHHVATYHTPEAFARNWASILDAVAPRTEWALLQRWRDCPHRVKAVGCGCDTCKGGPKDGQRVTLRGDCSTCPVIAAPE
jgi:glycosyltransferase involved in cell wall biosynthesis